MSRIADHWEAVNAPATGGRPRPANGAADAFGRQDPPARAANPAPMIRTLLGISEPDLERELLRKGVVRLAAGRAQCNDCGRTPLVGERVHVFDDGELVCELCRPRRHGAPERSEAVHHSERGHTVRRRAA
jgi:hypothetical protein